MSAALLSLKDAVSFLTVLPVPWAGISTDLKERVARAQVWFPLIGAAVAGLGALVAHQAAFWWPYPVATLLSLAAMVGITGALHLDGFTDTLDGLCSRKVPKEALRVMRDARIGAMGAAGLFFLLGIKWALLAGIPAERLFQVLIPTGCLSRWGIVLSGQLFPYIPGEIGLGRLVTDQRSWKVTALSLVVTWLLVATCVGFSRALLWMAGTSAFVWVVNRFFCTRLGGITGDTLGAVNELTEVGALLFLSRFL